MAGPLDKRLVFVTGKGGVGKTTVATAMALAGAARGKRTIVCEVSAQERISRAFRREGIGYSETELADNLYAISLDPARALEEYLAQQIGSERLSGLLFHNRLFEYFAAAAPGLRELATLGKVWEFAQYERRVSRNERPYDLVIVDAPASGHGLGMLRTPRTYGEIARVGPVRRQAAGIEKFITDPALTSVVSVALAQEMPVTETLEFRAKLREEMGIETEAVIVNALLQERFSSDEADRIEEAANGSPVVEAAVRAALSEFRRARSQRTQLRRLRRDEGTTVTLPFVWQPELRLEDLDRLANELERKL